VGRLGIQPGAERDASGVVERDLAVDAAFAVADDELPAPGGHHDVVDVERFHHTLLPKDL
jgi:hypothetical protein